MAFLTWKSNMYVCRLFAFIRNRNYNWVIDSFTFHQELKDCVLSKRNFVGYCCNLTEKIAIFQGFWPTSKCKVCLYATLLIEMQIAKCRLGYCANSIMWKTFDLWKYICTICKLHWTLKHWRPNERPQGIPFNWLCITYLRMQ